MGSLLSELRQNQDQEIAPQYPMTPEQIAAKKQEARAKLQALSSRQASERREHAGLSSAVEKKGVERYRSNTVTLAFADMNNFEKAINGLGAQLDLKKYPGENITMSTDRKNKTITLRSSVSLPQEYIDFVRPFGGR